MKFFSKIRHYPRLGLVLLAYVAFISLGLPDGLLGVAWPSIRAGFSQPLDALGLFLFAGTSGYLTSSFLNGKLINLMGVGGVLAASCGLTGAALLGYTLVPQWWMMVLLGVFSGLGAGAIDAGLNTYIAANFGEGLMQWLHASYGIGVTLGPIIMTGALNFFDSWRLGYRIVGFAQVALAASFLFTLRMWQTKTNPSATEEPRKLTDYATPYSQTLRQPGAWLGLLLFFLYTGSEVALGAWAYTLLTESRNIPVEVAGLWAGSYWAMFTVGRVLAGLFARRVGANGLVRGSLLLALLGSALLWWNPFPASGVLAVALIGFAIAPIFPGLVSGTIQRVGEQHTANTIGMQMAAAGLGVALIPGLIGVLARRISLEVIPLSLFLLFLLQLGLHQFSLLSRHGKASGSPQPPEA